MTAAAVDRTSTTEPGRRTRAALFLDFDNVFSGLHRLDPAVARRFAEHPEEWLERLRTTYLAQAPRRWLVLRCYLNPGGSVRGEDGAAGSVHYSHFRAPFVRAGFEVVDCPRLTHMKNAADIRMALDALDLVHAQPACEEFVVASGDSDMTPLLQRLRAADRRTTVVSPSDAAVAFTAVAEQVVATDEVLALVEGSRHEPEEAGGRAVDATVAAVAAHPAYPKVRRTVTRRYQQATEPLNMSILANQVREDVPAAFGSSTTDRWCGAGGFLALVHTLDLDGAAIGQHHLWDRTRHDDPDARTFDEAPDVVREVSAELGIPRLARGSWGLIHTVLAEYAATHEFNLTECTRWCRDRLDEQGTRIRRDAIGVAARGAAHGGAPLHRTPPPTAEEIRAAVVGNVIGRVEASDREIGAAERGALRSWFSA